MHWPLILRWTADCHLLLPDYSTICGGSLQGTPQAPLKMRLHLHSIGSLYHCKRQLPKGTKQTESVRCWILRDECANVEIWKYFAIRFFIVKDIVTL